MKNITKKYSTRNTLILTFVLAMILPLTSLALGFSFQADIAIDKPKVVEESIKAVVSFFISFMCLLLSNTYSLIEAEKKMNGLRLQTLSRIRAIENLVLQVIQSPELLNKSQLRISSTEQIRDNNKSEEYFKSHIGLLSTELEKISQTIIDSDHAISMGCSDISGTIFILNSSAKDFLMDTSAESAKKIKMYAQDLLILTKQ